MYDLCDTLYDFGAEHHKRKRKAESQFMSDLKHMCRINNHCLKKRKWCHHCWDEETGKPCHETDQEFYDDNEIAVHNGLYGRLEDIPAESRWTHTLPNMKATLMRHSLDGIGLRAFSVESATASVRDEDTKIDLSQVDDAQFEKAVEKNRLRRFTQYRAIVI